MRPELNCFLFALCKGACFSELQARCRAQAGAVCVQKFLSCQLALRVMAQR